MPSERDKTEVVVADWLAQFERTVSGDGAKLATLFHADSHWRDVLALTWSIETVSGRDAIVRALKVSTHQVKPTGLAIDSGRTAPRRVMRAGAEAIEAIFKFETADGHGSGVLRLTPDADGGALKAWTLLTAMEELKGHEEQVGKARPHGDSYSRDFRGPNWLDLRKASAAYADRDPTVLVVGGGQAGLSIAARLKQLKIDTLIVDREADRKSTRLNSSHPSISYAVFCLKKKKYMYIKRLFSIV